MDELPEELPALPFLHQDLPLFTEQLAAHQTTATVNAIVLIIDAWAGLGGTLWIGRGNERSCYLMARELDDKALWPVVFYPTGKCEVVFQYMAVRPPFDDVELRREFLNRLNKIPGVDLPEAKLELRPGFPLELLTDAASREVFIDALTWFFHQANPSAE